ncbi:MAG: DPP IV N-terminal domain-containing protein [Ignavibacteriaceae bacterium]
MKSLKYILFLLILVTAAGFCQKKELTIESVTKNARKFYPQTLHQLQWRPGKKEFSFVADSSLVAESTVSGLKDTILTLKNLNEKYFAAAKQNLTDFPTIEWIDGNNFRFWTNDSLWGYNFNNSELKLLNSTKDSADNFDCTLQNIAAYTIKNNLYVAVNNEQKQVTNDENEGIVNGQYCARNEYGIEKGTFWSPKENYLAFYRKNQTMVTDYPIVDISFHPAKLVNIKYPMAGMTSEQVTLGIYDLHTGKTIFLNTGEPKEHYLTGVSWDPDEKHVYIGILNRDPDSLWVIKYEIATGEAVDTLFRETNSKYLQPLQGTIFVENHLDEFIWISRRDGWNHLYLYKTDGKLIKQLTRGEWEVTDLIGFDSKGDNVYFMATKESPLENNLYSVNIESEKITRLTPEPGTHEVIKDKDGNYFLDRYSNLTVPGKILVINKKGAVERTVYEAENPLMDYNLGETKFLTLKSSDGYDLYCRMILPADFDSTKKYKALVYVYGGPGVQLITNEWLGGAGLWLNYMAAHGYVIFTIDSRGSANRGLAFEQVTFKHLGTHEIEDQTLGTNYLKSLQFVDSARVGVFGWSFGGFMTTSLMTRTPWQFKAAVAGGSVIDWSYYEIMYTERYMQTPQKNPDGYKESSLLNYVQNLKGKLLMIHGTSDPVVVWQNDLMFIKKCEDLGLPVDYIVYPGQVHGVRGIDTFHMYNKITKYFDDNL